jgi:DNA-directed RNA polymerase subunit RPC12/RpoP
MKCSRCKTEVPDEGLLTLQPTECPSCGKLLSRARPKWETGTSYISNYFSDVWKIIAHSVLFFRHMPLKGGITYPLTFALVTHWLGAALSYLWHLVMGGAISRTIQSLFHSSLNFAGHSANYGDIDSPGRNAMLAQTKDRIVDWFFGAGPVVIDPFLTLFSILFTSFFVFMGARILVSPGKNGHPREITYETAVRIVSFGLCPSILAGVPLVGGFVSSLAVVYVTIVGAKEVYKIETGRAIVVALFPKFLIFGILVSGLVLFAIFMLKIFAFA